MSASPKLVTRENGMIYVHWTDNAGKLQRKSCVTKDRRVARERMAEIVAGGWSAPIAQEKAASAKAKGREVTAENVTMAHLFDRCKATCWTPAKARSQSTIASICRILTPMIGDGPVTAMTYGRLEALASELRARGYAEATVDRKLSAIGSALTQAYKESDAQGRPWLIAKPVTPSFKADN